jgi:hypothetical protein
VLLLRIIGVTALTVYFSYIYKDMSRHSDCRNGFNAA